MMVLPIILGRLLANYMHKTSMYMALISAAIMVNLQPCIVDSKQYKAM